MELNRKLCASFLGARGKGQEDCSAPVRYRPFNFHERSELTSSFNFPFNFHYNFQFYFRKFRQIRL